MCFFLTELGLFEMAVGQGPGMEPTAYLIILGDPQRSGHWQLDCAAAAQNILVAAQAIGLGSCWLGSVQWDRVRDVLDIPDHLEGFGVISLGYPAQVVVVEEREGRLPERDEKDVLLLPKRPRGRVVHVDGYGGGGKRKEMQNEK